MYRKISKNSVAVVYSNLMLLYVIAEKTEPRTDTKEAHAHAFKVALNYFEKGFGISKRERENAYRVAVEEYKKSDIPKKNNV